MIPTRTTLIRRVRDRSDAASWCEFAELYQPLLVKYARRTGMSLHDAEDTAQEVLVLLFRKMPEFELDHQKGRFRGWLSKLVYHAVMTAHRRRQSRNRAEDARRAEDLERQIVVDADPPEEWLEDHRQRVLDFALERVETKTSSRTWACFEERILKQRPAAEIAQELGVTANQVWVSASRVLSKVREQCAEYEEELSHDDE